MKRVASCIKLLLYVTPLAALPYMSDTRGASAPAEAGTSGAAPYNLTGDMLYTTHYSVMAYVEPKNLTEIITCIDGIIRQVNNREISIATGAAYVVGATLANNSIDIDALLEAYPILEDLAELCASAELYDDEAELRARPDLRESLEWDWRNIQATFKRLREQLQ